MAVCTCVCMCACVYDYMSVWWQCSTQKMCVGEAVGVVVVADALSLQSCLAHVQQSSPFHSSGGRGGLGQPSLLKSVASVQS